jgi:hypothetical protein
MNTLEEHIRGTHYEHISNVRVVHNTFTSRTRTTSIRLVVKFSSKRVLVLVYVYSFLLLFVFCKFSGSKPW